MPIRLVQAATNQALWAGCAEAFLAEALPQRGPRGHRVWIWITHRILRDRLLQEAAARGCPGWLDPPISFFSELPQRFRIEGRRIGLLARRRLIGRLAARHGGGLTAARQGSDALLRGHMLDSLFGELLPEGIGPERLSRALRGLGGDRFARQRNEWIARVYAAYLGRLERAREYDERQVHALVAERIEAGGLREAIGGAGLLHVYGITTVRHRQRLLRALATQREVEVRLYMVEEPDTEEDAGGEFADLAEAVQRLEDAGAARPRVQPAPDAAREVEWVARELKRLLLRDESLRAEEVAVVARSGREDTRRVAEALRRYGVPCTVRVRTPLAHIGALRAVAALFRGAARDWDYRALRAVLTNSYFRTGVDARWLDHVAQQRRIQGLEAWRQQLERLAGEVAEEERARQQRREARATETEGNEADARPRFLGTGLFADRLERDVAAFASFCEAVAPLREPRSEAEWVELTLALLRQDPFALRRRLSEPVQNRWEIVRTDQRGVLQAERLLAEWGEIADSTEPLEVAEWSRLLARLLEAHALALTTPEQRGVQVLEAHDAALVPFRHTFLVHANDGEFPRARIASGLLDDEESARLRASGVPLADRTLHARRERALWRAVTAQAAGVTITYRTTGAGGAPLLPSLMVPEHDPGEELPRTRAPDPEAEPWAPDEADRAAVARLARAVADDSRQAGAPAPGNLRLAAARPERLRRALLAAVAELHRDPEGRLRSPEDPALRPNPWNGLVRASEVLEALARRSGPEHVWSASALELYGRCPFLFLLERVLRIRRFEEADEQTSAQDRGALTHRLLQRFYERYGDGLPAEFGSDERRRLEQLAREVFDEAEREMRWLGHPSLWRVTRRSVVDDVCRYLEWELQRFVKERARPWRSEYAFGYDDHPVVLEGRDLGGRPTRLLLRGRIDRVDEVAAGRGGRQLRYQIVDYKGSSRPQRSGYEDGSLLQAVLYARVLEQQGLEVDRSLYRPVRGSGTRGNAAIIRPGDGGFERALVFALSIPGRIRRGAFEPVKAAATGGWQEWEPPVEIVRSRAVLPRGTDRFSLDVREG